MTVQIEHQLWGTCIIHDCTNWVSTVRYKAWLYMTPVQAMQTDIITRPTPRPRDMANCCILTTGRGQWEHETAELRDITICNHHAVFYIHSFGNPNHDEMSILAPLVQCCRYTYMSNQYVIILYNHVKIKINFLKISAKKNLREQYALYIYTCT